MEIIQPVVVTDSTTINVNGEYQIPPTTDTYHNLIPVGAEVMQAVCTLQTVNNPRMLHNTMKDAHVLYLLGGNNLAIAQAMHPPPAGSSNDEVSLVRDLLNYKMLEEALEQDDPHHTFILGVCRGMQAVWDMYDIPARFVGKNHRQGESPFTHDIDQIEYNSGLSMQLPEITEINSAHNYGFYASDITANMYADGWRITHVAKDGVVEIMVRVTPDGRISGILFQGHPERFESIDGKMLQEWVRRCIIQHVESLSQEVVTPPAENMVLQQ